MSVLRGPENLYMFPCEKYMSVGKPYRKERGLGCKETGGGAEGETAKENAAQQTANTTSASAKLLSTEFLNTRTVPFPLHHFVPEA